jgi:hypothetical protein
LSNLERSLRRRFEQNQEDASLTILSWLPSVAEYLMDALPVESLTEDLKRLRRQQSTKDSAAQNNTEEVENLNERRKAMWEQLKQQCQLVFIFVLDGLYQVPWFIVPSSYALNYHHPFYEIVSSSMLHGRSYQ